MFAMISKTEACSFTPEKIYQCQHQFMLKKAAKLETFVAKVSQMNASFLLNVS